MIYSQLDKKILQRDKFYGFNKAAREISTCLYDHASPSSLRVLFPNNAYRNFASPMIENCIDTTNLSYNLPCIPKSLSRKSFLLTAISLDAKKSLFSSDSMLSCSKAPKSSNPRLILSNLTAGMTSAHRNLSSWSSTLVKLLDSSNSRYL